MPDSFLQVGLVVSCSFAIDFFTRDVPRWSRTPEAGSARTTRCGASGLS